MEVGQVEICLMIISSKIMRMINQALRVSENREKIELTRKFIRFMLVYVEETIHFTIF